jgi:uncharacterized membrane protein
VSETRAKRISRCLFGALFVAAGANHFLNTSLYTSIVPSYLPWPMGLVYVSGLAEIVLGVLLCTKRFRVAAAWGLVALLIAVFPANLHMALNPELYPRIPEGGLWLRLPVQAVLIAWALWYTRREPVAPSTGHSTWNRGA